MRMNQETQTEKVLARMAKFCGHPKVLPLISLFLGGALTVGTPLATQAGSISQTVNLDRQNLPVALDRSSTSPLLLAQVAVDETASRYLVYVDGDSPLLLQQVQGVEPTAFRRFLEDRTVIQAGVFEDAVNAERRVQELSTQGLTGNIATVTVAELAQIETPPAAAVAAAPVPAVEAAPVYAPAPVATYPDPAVTTYDTTGAVVTTGAPPATAVAASAPTQVYAAPAVTAPVPAAVYETPTPVYSVPNVTDTSSPTPPPLTATYYDAGPAPLPRGYYVAIPARGDADLAVLQDKVIGLRTGGWGLYPRRGPLGRHVAVGPFAKRHSAESWSEYYRANDLDARVFRSTR